MAGEKNWVVVGAGPAGIAAVASLLDHKHTNILWIDPHFDVGNLSQYPEVPGNTIMRLLEGEFFDKSPSFGYADFKTEYKLCTIDRDGFCMLDDVISIFRRISRNLLENVNVEIAKTFVESMELKHKFWELKGKNNVNYISERVILAIGAEPTIPKLEYIVRPPVIPLETALSPSKLKSLKTTEVAVFGSSHSAVLAIMNLVALGIPVTNVYKSDVLFASIKPEGYENWFTGLKGAAAAWAMKNLVNEIHPLVKKVHFNDRECEQKVNNCSQVVYATGFTKRSLKGMVPGNENVIGLGIAFPELVADCNGKIESAIGFVNFLQKINNDLSLIK